ncbi:MAG: alginate export family protein [Rhodothermales bacterium]|nr:alginate export family protein [Rhodothermales bacterium]MBO6778733.1 alginate export family protein [Rhodothermales bacterium]
MRSIFLVLALLLIPSATKAQTTRDILTAFRQGTPVVNLRLRGEHVTRDGIDDPARALTLRSAFGYRSGSYQGLTAFIEAEAVTALPDDDGYANAGAGALNNRVTDRPVIADPVATEVNQAYLRYAAEKATVTLGRQEIIFSDSRLVGNVGWRQNHQSFDAARIDISPDDGLSMSYALVREAHRITGQDAAMQSHLAEARVRIADFGSAIAYATLLDYDDAVGLSRSTFGGRFEGSRALGDDFLGRIEVGYALQSDAFDNPEDITTDYMLFGGRVGRGSSALHLRWERLGGSEADGAFVTPLATLHKFNGWADAFLATPPRGLVDLEVGFATELRGARMALILHDFSSDEGGLHYGRELDFSAAYATAAGLKLGAKVAHYVADEGGADTTKLWIWTVIGL